MLPDILAIKRGAITAPAGCGKTHLIADALTRHAEQKPVLILTHTNAGVAALRWRLEKFGVRTSAYRLSTIDGWAMRLCSMFPLRSQIATQQLALEQPKFDYPAIRLGALALIAGRHIDDVLCANFSRLVVDEYQDCSVPQHALINGIASVLPTCVLGDPMQAIFGFGEPLAHWEQHVCACFPIHGELTIPWRWKNADSETLGLWLLDARRQLLAGQPIDLTKAPPEVIWVRLEGKDDHERRLKAARVKPPNKDGKVLIIGDSVNPPGQHQIASQTPGAVTVESVDMRDLVAFAKSFDLRASDALNTLITFAARVMTNVGGPDLMKRVAIIADGSNRKPPNEVENAALRFAKAPTYEGAIEVLVEIGKQGGTHTHRRDVFQACIRTLRQCGGPGAPSLYDAALAVREQNRFLGRPLPSRGVGSTLTLKGLEADVVVILDPTQMNARNLYVAMTRGSRQVVICSAAPMLAGQGRN